MPSNYLFAVDRFADLDAQRIRGDTAAVSASFARRFGSGLLRPLDLHHRPDFELPRVAVARWESNGYTKGLEWLIELVDAGRASGSINTGYPGRFLLRCDDFRQQLSEGIPDEAERWAVGYGDIITDKWLGRTTIYDDVLATIPDEEWLLVEVWDNS